MRILLIEPNNERYDEAVLSGPLGGSETVFLFLVRVLSRWPNVELDTFFRGDGDFQAFVRDEDYDLVIAYRSPQPLFQVRGRINAVWLQDMPNEFVLPLLGVLKQQGRLEYLICLSHFQKEAYLRNLGGALDEGRHVLMLDNPIDLSLFDDSIPKEPACIYASAPNRGLDVLLSMWPEIHEALPAWELRIAGSTTMYNVGQQEANAEREGLLAVGEELYARAQAMAGVRLLGGLGHADLIVEMEKASALLYPSTWPETSCHVLNCALHAGCVPFVSSVGAVAEKVTAGDNGIVILGDPHSPQFQAGYVQAFIEAVETGRLERMIKVNRGMYLAWGVERMMGLLLNRTLEHCVYEGLNQRVMGVTCALKDRGRERGWNWRNLRWYAPTDVLTDEIVGLPIDQARNAAAGMTMYSGADWLLFLDDDVFVDRLFVHRMLERAREYQADIVVANYAYKDSGALVATMRIVENANNRAVNVYELTEAEANGPDYRFVTAGAGALLVSRRALEAIGRPWFRTQATMRGKHTGEDSHFFRMCQLVGLKVWMALDEPTVHRGKDGRLYGRVEDVALIEPQIIQPSGMAR